MGKQGRSRRGQADPEDVLAGRVRVGPRELIALIRRVNPTGLDLPAGERARRYTMKSRLQNLLVRRFQAELTLELDPAEPGVVLLLHRPSGAEACHAPLSALDEDARAWIQRQIDLGEVGAESAPAAPRAGPTASPTLAGAGTEGAPAQGDADLDQAPVAALRSAGRAALAEYDFDLARRCLEGALERSDGDGGIAAELLELFVDHLAADEDALALGARLPKEAARRADVRLLLAVAAARRGARATALEWLAALPGPRAAEALSTLARAALDAGDLDVAVEDLAEAEARDPAHPALRAISDAIAARRAAERMPLEAELLRWLDDGEIDLVALRAREILGRWPDSAAARRALDLAEAERRRAAAARALAEADQELAAGQVPAALGLLRQALAGVSAEEALGIQGRIDAIEAEERARAEAAEIARVVSLLEAGDVPSGLVAYAALPGQQRRAVQAQVDRPHLGWLDEISAHGEGARARAAVQAVLALGRAEELAEQEPEAALSLLKAEARLLGGVRHARKLVEETAQRAAAQRRTAARAALEGALRAEETAHSTRARALLKRIAAPDVPASVRNKAEALRARLDRRKARRDCAAQIEEARRRGEVLLARRWAEEAALTAEDAAERARWAELVSEIQADVQAAFRVQDLDPGVGAAPHDLDLLRVRGVCSSLCPGAQAFLVAQSQGVWVFLRLYELTTSALRSCVVLRAPRPMEIMRCELDGDRVILLGATGHALDLVLGTWQVARWYSLVSRPGGDGVELPVPAGPPPTSGAGAQREPGEQEPPPPVLHVHRFAEARRVPGGPLLWVVGLQDTVTVLDAAADRQVRELSLARAQVRPVPGPREPLVAVVCREGASLALYTGRGVPVAPERRLPAVAMADGLAPAPSGDGLFVMARATRGAAAGKAPEVGWLEVPFQARGQVGQLRPLPGAAGTQARAAATDMLAGMTFVLLEPAGAKRDPAAQTQLPRGCALLAFARGEPGEREPLELRYRVQVPARAVLMQEGQSGPVVLVVARGDRFDAVRLGPAPPASAEEDPSAPAEVPLESLTAVPWRCAAPGGALGNLALTFREELLGKSPRVLGAVAERAKGDFSDDGLAGLCVALMSLGSTHLGLQLLDWAFQRHPDHAGLSMLQGGALVQARRWRDARALLSRVERVQLDPRMLRHLYHLWATASLHLGEREEARSVLGLGEAFEGQCALGWLWALATPLEEEREWTPEEAAIRDLARAVSAADACLAQGDAAGAVRALDRRVVWESWEVQSLARLAEAHLLVDGDGPEGRLRKALTLSAFQEAEEEHRISARREIPMPTGTWPAARLEALRERAKAWLDETLGGPASKGNTTVV